MWYLAWNRTVLATMKNQLSSGSSWSLELRTSPMEAAETLVKSWVSELKIISAISGTMTAQPFCLKTKNISTACHSKFKNTLCASSCSKTWLKNQPSKPSLKLEKNSIVILSTKWLLALFLASFLIQLRIVTFCLKKETLQRYISFWKVNGLLPTMAISILRLKATHN